MAASTSLITCDLLQIKKDLILSHRQCSQRGLLQSAKWMAELQFALKKVEVDFSDIPKDGIIEESGEEYSNYLLGKSYFDLREFDRAAFFTEQCLSPIVRFLHLFAQYSSSEKKKYDDSVESGSHHDSHNIKTLGTLRAELQKGHPNNSLDGFMLYLYGVILKKLGLITDAVSVLTEAVNKEPMHWGAWLELATLLTDKEMLSSLTLPEHWIKQFFLAHTYLDLQLNEDALTIYQSLCEAGFQDSTYIAAQIAIAYHNMRDVDQAVETFQDLQKIDPFRLDNMDTYSNLLYVKEMKVELSHLAHSSCEIDKYRVETCCVIGNYYSLRAQHEKAVLYFQRALKLNPNYLSAWTLMGHEYMELKNTAAAIQAYRQAIHVNRRDYRAWYGLGQTYEILKMPFYCLYYYRQAQQLRPYDSRMLVALGESYEKLDRLLEARKCFWKAHCVGDIEGMALVKLAKLYEKSKDEMAAAAAYSEYLRELEVQGLTERDEQCHAHQYLANHYLAQNKIELAYQHAFKCMDYNETREEAKALLKQIAELRGGGPGALPMQVEEEADNTAISMEGGDTGTLAPINLTFSQ